MGTPYFKVQWFDVYGYCESDCSGVAIQENTQTYFSVPYSDCNDQYRVYALPGKMAAIDMIL